MPIADFFQKRAARLRAHALGAYSLYITTVIIFKYKYIYIFKYIIMYKYIFIFKYKYKFIYKYIYIVQTPAKSNI